MATRWSGVKKWLGDSLELPQDVIFHLPRITMVGQYQVYVENHRGVTRFTNEQLRIRLAAGQLLIKGDRMVIRRISSDELLLEGEVIRSITFLDEKKSR